MRALPAFALVSWSASGASEVACVAGAASVAPAFAAAFFRGRAGAVFPLAGLGSAFLAVVLPVEVARGEDRRFLGLAASGGAESSPVGGASTAFFARAARFGLVGASPGAVPFFVAGLAEDLRVAGFLGAFLAEAGASVAGGASASAGAFSGLATRLALAGAFFAADLAVDLRGVGFLAAFVLPESVAGTSVPAPPSLDASFLAEVREAARFGLAIATVLEDLRVVDFFAAGFAEASSLGASAVAALSSEAVLAAVFLGLAARLAGVFPAPALAADFRGVCFLAAPVSPESAPGSSAPGPPSSGVAFLAEVRETVLFGLLAATVLEDLRVVDFFAAGFAGTRC